MQPGQGIDSDTTHALVQFNSDQRLSVVPLRNVVTSGNLVRIGCCYTVKWMGLKCDAVVMAIGTKQEAGDEESGWHGKEGDQLQIEKKAAAVEGAISGTVTVVKSEESGVAGVGVEIKQESMQDETKPTVNAKKPKKNKNNKKKSKALANPKVENKTTNRSHKAAKGKNDSVETKEGIAKTKEMADNVQQTKRARLQKLKSKATANSKRSIDEETVPIGIKASKRHKTEEKVSGKKTQQKSKRSVKFSKKIAVIKKKRQNLRAASHATSTAAGISLHPVETTSEPNKDSANPSYWSYLESKVMGCERGLTEMRCELERRDHDMKGQMENVINLLDARLPLHRPNPFVPRFPYPIYPPPHLSVPAPPPRGHYQYVNGWSYHLPRMPADASVYQHPNMSYIDNSCGAEIQLLSSPGLSLSSTSLQQDGLVQPGESRSRQSLSQSSVDPASPSSPTQLPNQEQQLSSPAELSHSSSQQATIQPKKSRKTRQAKVTSMQSSSQESTVLLSKSCSSRRLRSALKSTSADQSSSAVQKLQSCKPKHQRQVKRSAKRKKQ